MSMRAYFLVWVCACACTPTTAPAPSPVPVGDACENAQSNLEKLGCDWKKNSAGQAWGQSCHILADKGYPRIREVAICVHMAKTCDDGKACK